MGTIRGSLKVSFEESLEELFGAILEELLKEFFFDDFWVYVLMLLTLSRIGVLSIFESEK